MRAALDICLLALIAEKERYGYELVRELDNLLVQQVVEGSVYPLLRRMEKQGLVVAHLVASEGGPARTYYRLTGEGRDYLLASGRRFVHFADSVKCIVEGRIDPGKS